MTKHRTASNAMFLSISMIILFNAVSPTPASATSVFYTISMPHTGGSFYFESDGYITQPLFTLHALDSAHQPNGAITMISPFTNLNQNIYGLGPWLVDVITMRGPYYLFGHGNTLYSAMEILFRDGFGHEVGGLTDYFPLANWDSPGTYIDTYYNIYNVTVATTLPEASPFALIGVGLIAVSLLSRQRILRNICLSS